MKKFVLNILLATSLISCEMTQEPAQVEYHIDDYYGYKDAEITDEVMTANVDTNEVIDQSAGGRLPAEVEIEDVSTDYNNVQMPSDEVIYGPTLANGNQTTPDNTYGPLPMIKRALGLDEEKKEESSNIGNSKIVKSELAPQNQTIEISETTHKVSEGDTLYSLSRKYDIPILPIIIANNLNEPYSLKKDTLVKIPSAKFHIVSDTDTLYGISRKYAVDMTSVAKTNNLSEPYSIYQGQKLQIPFPNYSKQNEIATEQVVKEIKKKEIIPEQPKTLTAQKLPNENIKFTAVKETNGFVWPVKGKVVKKFGANGNEHNDGINISANAGDSVKASKSGKVVFVGDSLKSFGNLVIIKHANGLLSAYAHLSKISVKKDQNISQNQEVGKVGNTGKVDSPQLYFAVRKGKQAMNPLNYLN